MTRITLTQHHCDEISRGRFVRVGRVETLLVGRVGGTWRAYENVCRHRALPLDLGAKSPMSDDGRYLLCNQHGALYRLEDGRCVGGPCAGDGLVPVAVTEDERGALLFEPRAVESPPR